MAQLDIADDFTTDNRAYLAVADTPPLRVLYVGPGNPYLNNLFRFFANIELTTLARWDDGAAQMAGKFDVVICDRVAPPALTQGNFIFINTLPVKSPLVRQAALANPRLASAAGEAPVNRWTQLGRPASARSRAVAVKMATGVALARIAQRAAACCLRNCQAAARLSWL